MHISEKVWIQRSGDFKTFHDRVSVNKIRENYEAKSNFSAIIIIDSDKNYHGCQNISENLMNNRIFTVSGFCPQNYLFILNRKMVTTLEETERCPLSEVSKLT